MLSEENRDNIRAFNLLVTSKMPRQSFEDMRYTFRHKVTIASEYTIFRQMGILSGVKPIIFDCCPNSCIAYTKKFIYYQSCPFCNEPRVKDRKPRRSFTYFPLIPRLQGYFQSATMIEKMAYRSNHQQRHGEILDVFDGKHYQQLRKHRVVVDGVKLNHRYFSDPHDIALSLCTDSYLLFKRRRKGPSATPILLQNYNLPPQIHTHLRNLICIGIIPGPKQPKDLESFLSPLDDESVELAYGVKTFNAIERSTFDLHAYVLFKLGDIIAIEKFLQIKGHNAIYPCRSCKIRAVRGTGKTYYVPLRPPKNMDLDLDDTQGEEVEWDPESLPLRKHVDFIETTTRIRAALTKAEKERIAKETGIKNIPAMSRVGSLDYARSFPWEWFHLLLENIIPNLVDFWTGQFKGLGEGVEEFEIAPKVWEEVGRETAAAVQHIPSTFVRVLGNIASDRSLFTAESWSFWFIYLAPKLLEKHFHKQKYYTHMCELVELMKLMLQFRITLKQVDELEQGLICWVKKYERYVFTINTDWIWLTIICELPAIITNIVWSVFQLAL